MALIDTYDARYDRLKESSGREHGAVLRAMKDYSDDAKALWHLFMTSLSDSRSPAQRALDHEAAGHRRQILESLGSFESLGAFSSRSKHSTSRR